MEMKDVDWVGRGERVDALTRCADYLFSKKNMAVREDFIPLTRHIVVLQELQN